MTFSEWTRQYRALLPEVGLREVSPGKYELTRTFHDLENARSMYIHWRTDDKYRDKLDKANTLAIIRGRL